MLRKAKFVHTSKRRTCSPYERADRQQGHSESVQNLQGKHAKAEWDRGVQLHPMLDLIISDLLPHTIVGEPGFLRFLQSIKYSCLPTDFILSELKNLHLITTGFVQDQLERVHNVALSSELWKTTANKMYMTTTCHLIDDAWTQKSFVLETTPLPEAYTPSNVVVQLFKIARNWRIENKIKVAITNVDGMKMEFKNYEWEAEHIPCFAHTLDVVFKETLEESPDWKELITKCCDIAQYFSQKFEAQGQLKEAQTKLRLSPDNLIESNGDRWLSTLKMLERITAQHKAICQVLILSNDDLFLTESENEDIHKAIACLRVFQGVMTADTAKRYHLLSNVIPQVQDIKQKLRELELSGNEFAEELAESFINHFDEIKENDWLTLSTALDVRYRDTVLTERTNLTCIKIKITGEMLETRVRQPDNLDKALNRYFNKERMGWDPNAFWKLPKDEDWHLSEVARKYLTAVSTAMPAEVAFDTEKASLVATRRSSLDPQHLNMMLFLNGNSFELSATKSQKCEIYNLFEALNI